MKTDIIYETAEKSWGIDKGWSVRVIGVFDDSLTLVEFVDGQGLYAVIDGGFFSAKLQKVTLKFAKFVKVYDNLIDAIADFAEAVSRRRFDASI